MVKKLRLVTLSENSGAQGHFLAEWGLSILMEADGRNILLDTGRSTSVVYNAQTLGIDLRKMDKIVLSHSHYDHTGGLREVLRCIGKDEIEVVAHPDIWEERYTRRKGKKDRYLGMPYPRPELENFGAVFRLSREPVALGEGIMTTGEVPLVTDFERMDSGEAERLIKKGNRYRPDELRDDLSIVIKTELGLVVVTGCAHRGLINTLLHARKLTGEKRIYTVIGGAHLIDVPEERVTRTIAVLKEMDIPKLGLCHCTSLKAISRLAYELGDRFFFNNSGTVVKIPPEEK